MGPRQKPHGEGLLYDSLHVKHTVEVSYNLCACQRRQSLLYSSSSSLEVYEGTQKQALQIKGFSCQQSAPVLCLICMHCSFHEHYGDEAHNGGKQSAPLRKFAALNVRIINELRVSVPACPAWCPSEKTKRSCPCAHKFLSHSTGTSSPAESELAVTRRDSNGKPSGCVRDWQRWRGSSCAFAPFQGVKQTEGRRWIMDVVAMIVRKRRDRGRKRGRRGVFPKPGQMSELVLLCIQTSVLISDSYSKHKSCLLVNLYRLLICLGTEQKRLLHTTLSGII